VGSKGEKFSASAAFAVFSNGEGPKCPDGGKIFTRLIKRLLAQKTRCLLLERRVEKGARESVVPWGSSHWTRGYLKTVEQ